MKSVSRFALIFAVSALPFTGVWAADDAKPAKEEKAKKEKKGKEEKAPAAAKVVNSKEFLAVYAPVVQPYAKKKDPTTAATAKEAWSKIKAAATTDDDRYTAGLFAIDVASQLKDQALRAEALDLLIASTKTPDKEKQIYYFSRGGIAYDTKNWPSAAADLQKSYDMGFRRNDLEGGTEILIADALSQQGKYVDALGWLTKSEEGSKVAGAKPLPSNFYAKGANFAMKTKDYGYIAPWWQKLVRANGTAPYWHDALMQIYNNVDLDSQEILDLHRLLRTVGAMQYQQNYTGYATESIATFFPTEVKALLEEGFAKKTINQNSATFRDLYAQVTDKLKVDPFSLTQLDKDIASAPNGYQAAVAGDMALSVGEYARAITAYNSALAKGNIVDAKEKKDLTERTVFRLAVAKAQSGDVAGARADFAKVTSSDRKPIADYWLIWLDQKAKVAAAPAATPAS